MPATISPTVPEGMCRNVIPNVYERVLNSPHIKGKVEESKWQQIFSTIINVQGDKVWDFADSLPNSCTACEHCPHNQHAVVLTAWRHCAVQGREGQGGLPKAKSPIETEGSFWGRGGGGGGNGHCGCYCG